MAAIREMRPGIIRFGGSALETYEWDQCLGSWDARAPFEQAYWGGRRAAHGHPKPYGVKYWQIGNEVGGPLYDESVRAFAEAIRKADPSAKVLSSFPSTETLRAGGGYLDYLCPHHYGCADLIGMESSFNSLEEPDVSAVLSPDGRTLRIYGVNSTDKTIDANTTLAGFAGGVTRATILVLKDTERALTAEMMNSRDEPERGKVFERSGDWRGTSFVLSFEPFSLTLCELGF